MSMVDSCSVTDLCYHSKLELALLLRKEKARVLETKNYKGSQRMEYMGPFLLVCNVRALTCRWY